MVKKLETKIHIFIIFFSKYLCKCQTFDEKKKRKNVKRTSKLLHISIHLITVCKKNASLEKPVTFNDIIPCLLIINILLTDHELSQSAQENLDLSCVCTERTQ